MLTSGTDHRSLRAGGLVKQSGDGDLRWILGEIEQHHKDVLVGLLCAWRIGVDLFLLNDDAFRNRIPTAIETKIHQNALGKLILIGHFFAPRIRNFGPRDLAKFGLDREQLLTTVTKLEAMTAERFTASGTIEKLTEYISRAQKAIGGI
jgi:hypothetical protein